jgi:respiratory burst oxidase
MIDTTAKDGKRSNIEKRVCQETNSMMDLRNPSTVCSNTLDQKWKQDAIDLAFHKLDMSNSGLLDRNKLSALIEQTSMDMELGIPISVIIDATDALMEDAGAFDKEYVTKKQFQSLFDHNPDLLKCTDDEIVEIDIYKSDPHQSVKNQRFVDYERESDEVWESIPQVHWKVFYERMIWICLYLAANVAAFTSKGVIYANADNVKNVFGSYIIVARGSAQCLNLNYCLILLPVCRHVLTRLRATKLRFFFPFDTSMTVHIYLGIAILFFTVLHVAAHACGFINFTNADQDNIMLLFHDKNLDVPEGARERWIFLLGTTAGITGVIMLVCMLVAYPIMLLRRRNFNAFWFSHHLLIIMIITLCFHGIGNLLEPFESVYWIMVPFTLYIAPRILRETSFSNRKILDIRVKNVVAITLERPKNWDNLVRPGMYAYLNVPKISQYEWHPFSLTSAPYEDLIEFHCAKAGDWTGKLHDLVKDSTFAETGLSKPGMISEFVLKVEGPIGASSQGFKDYSIVVLIGAGIGVTPMISVLKELLINPGKMERLFFYWTVRKRCSFEWFSKIMDDIFEYDKKHVLEVRHFWTSVKEDHQDVGSVLLHHATRARHSRTSFDLLLGHYNHRHVQIGRPKWTQELRSVKEIAKSLAHDSCGVFLSGPNAMAVEVSSSCYLLTKHDPGFYFHFSKETF